METNEPTHIKYAKSVILAGVNNYKKPPPPPIWQISWE